MKEYLGQIGTICDSLAATRNPLIETMHIFAILSKLSPEYEPFVTVITSSQQLYKIDGVCSVLIDTEARQQGSVSQNLFMNMIQDSLPNVLQGDSSFQNGSFPRNFPV
ncbi:hypothetical protein HRI_002739900 [Hibiscus trionum]|uniref:Uncharacterized protein n=1 Tax=Hibiscus trionum TaxID=183268 RepID=A0A9W7I8B6_HIBTR|nr:hypothetical protein HRI_002739900 [Hibiscus trionum]